MRIGFVGLGRMGRPMALNILKTGYPMKCAFEDLVSAAEISADLCIPLPTLHAAMATYRMASLRGRGDLSKGALISVFEELPGVKYRKPPAGNETAAAGSRIV